MFCSRSLCYHALRDEIINSVAFPQLKNKRKLLYFFLCFSYSAFNYPTVPRSLLSILPYYDDAKSKQEKKVRVGVFLLLKNLDGLRGVGSMGSEDVIMLP